MDLTVLSWKHLSVYTLGNTILTPTVFNLFTSSIINNFQSHQNKALN